MKRMVSLLLALGLVLALTACGGKQKDAFTTDLAAFYESQVNENFPMMMELTDDMIDGIYPGLTDVARSQTVLYIAAISATPCEIAMVEVANPGDVDTVKDIFQARIDSQVAGGAWYPDTIEQWQKNAQIVVRGSCVCLFVVSPELGSPAEDFNAL